MRDVGDVDREPVSAAGEPLDVHGIVKVLSRLAVNRHHRPAAEVAAALKLYFQDVLWRSVRLRQHLRRKTVRQVELADDDFHVHTEFVASAEDFEHAAPKRRGAARLGEVRDLDVHDLSVELARAPNSRHLRPGASAFGFAAELPVAPAPGAFLGWPLVPARDDDFVRNALVEGQNDVLPRPAAELADHGHLRALDDTENAPFEAHTVPRPRHEDVHAVSVKRRAHRGGRNENVEVGRGEPLVRHDEPVTFAVPNQATAHDVLLVGSRFSCSGGRRSRGGGSEGEPVVLRALDLSRSHQPLERALQFPHLARPQAEYEDEFSQPILPMRMSFEQGEDFAVRGEFAHSTKGRLYHWAEAAGLPARSAGPGLGERRPIATGGGGRDARRPASGQCRSTGGWSS